jgi:hypothetical protein
MTTVTAEKREFFPVRYVRKDARTAIYRALYGRPDTNYHPVNDPVLDPSRELPDHWEHKTAAKIFEKHIDDAQFSASKRAELERRLDTLKHHKPRPRS